MDLDQGTSTVVLCDVYCYRLISTVVLMCNSSSLVTSTVYETIFIGSDYPKYIVLKFYSLCNTGCNSV